MASGLHERLPKFYLRKLREWKNKEICKKLSSLLISSILMINCGREKGIVVRNNAKKPFLRELRFMRPNLRSSSL